MTVVERLASLVVSTGPGRRVRVAIDGAGCSGKSTLADRLAVTVGPQRPVVRASIDDFMHPRSVRYRQGSESAWGCYEDTFDLDALRAKLLDPLGPVGSGRYRTRVFDRFADRPVSSAEQVAASDAVLLLDGVHLQRRQLSDCWDLVVHLRVPDAELLRRARLRDVELFGDAESVEHRYRTRYLAAERLYEQQVGPVERADVVLDNTDPVAPMVLKWPG
ncbi:MAG: uridine kinase [Actinobacteria bacterium]|nr:uridine kinase [Actinomycetota bacterium]MBW3648105.1 uridine kinase [Actinomycetota bacterium]